MTSSALRVWYLPLLYGGLASIVLGNFFRQRSGDEFATITMIYPGLAAVIFGVVSGCVLLYRSWRCLARHAAKFDAKRKILDPAGAVALTVVPLVNIIGMFFSLVPLPRELNWLASAAGVEARAPKDLGIATALIALCAVVPVIGILSRIVAGLILLPILLISCSKVADAVEIRLGSAPSSPSST